MAGRDNSPDFFITGGQNTTEWVEEIALWLEKHYDLKGKYSERDFIGGRPVLDQITDMIKTCRCTVVVFDVRSQWADYTAKAALHMITEGNSSDKKQVIIVIKNKLAARNVPDCFQCYKFVNADYENFYEKLFDSITYTRPKVQRKLDRSVSSHEPKQETRTIQDTNTVDREQKKSLNRLSSNVANMSLDSNNTASKGEAKVQRKSENVENKHVAPVEETCVVAFKEPEFLPKNEQGDDDSGMYEEGIYVMSTSSYHPKKSWE
ncbi:uncharacterized protein LOC144342560 [Saccoglossus kowalevskii]